jgi:hypothetical protein
VQAFVCRGIQPSRDIKWAGMAAMNPAISLFGSPQSFVDHIDCEGLRRLAALMALPHLCVRGFNMAREPRAIE